MKKNQLFFKYLMINLSLVFVIFVGCLVNVFYTYDLEKKAIIEQNEEELARSVRALEGMLNSIYSLSSALRSNTSIQSLSRYKGEELPTDKYVLKNYLKKDLSDIQMIADISATGFVLFRDNPVFVSNVQTAGDFGEYYGEYLEVEGKSAEEFKQEIMECTDPITCRTYPLIKIYNYGLKMLENPFVVIIRIRESNQMTIKTMAFTFVIDQDDIYQKLFAGSSGNNLICICDKNGNILNSFGEGAEFLKEYVNVPIEKNKVLDVNGVGHYLQIAKESVNGSSIIIAVPTKQVKKQTLRLVGVNLVVTAAAIIFSIVMIILLSYRKSASMQDVLDDINERSESRFLEGDEYKFIKKNVEYLADSRDVYQKELSELRTQMDNTLLEQMFFQETLSLKMKELCEKLIPFELQYYEVLVIQCEEEGYEYLPEIFYLLEKISGQFIHQNHLCVQTAVNEVSFLVGRSQEELIQKEEEMKRLSLFLQKVTEESGEILHIGVSGIGMEISNIHTCYIQAKQALTCYSREHINTIGYYSDLLDASGENLLNMDNISKLYQYLLSGKEEIFMDALDKLLRHYHMNPYIYGGDPRGIYYSIRQALLCAAAELSISESELMLPEWNSSYGLEAGIKNLKDAAIRLLEANQENKKSHNNELKECIINYILQNFHDPSLTASMVCQEMKISQKYLIQFLKEQTGKTFAKYIEDLRVEKAKELLLNTDYSNERIAGEAGFGSMNSFYRVFNKKTGVSPGAFRKK